MSQNFYEEKIAEIKSLISQNQKKEAINLLQEELKMPYIPHKYEKEFLELFDNLNQSVLKEVNKKHYSIDELSEMLFEDEYKQLEAIEALKNVNVRPIQNDIKKRIETYTNKESIKRAFLFELLAEQEISIDISIDNETLNPLKDSIVKNKEVKLAIEALPYIVAKRPQMYEIVFNELQRYLLLTFPKFPKNGRELIEQIYHIALSIFEPEQELTQEEKNIFEILNHD